MGRLKNVVILSKQYGKYFPSFSYSATFYTSLWVNEMIAAKYEMQGNKYFVCQYCMRQRAITS